MTMMEKEGGKVCIQRIIFSLAAIGSMQYHPIILRACLSLVIISAKNLKRHVSFLKVLYAKTCAYKDICVHLFCHPTLTAKFFYNFPHRTFQPVRSFNGQCNGSGTQPISLIFEYFQITLPGECILETKWWTTVWKLLMWQLCKFYLFIHNFWVNDEYIFFEFFKTKMIDLPKVLNVYTLFIWCLGSFHMTKSNYMYTVLGLGRQLSSMARTLVKLKHLLQGAKSWNLIKDSGHYW